MEGCTRVEALLRSLCGFNIFWPKGCFEFGCLPPLCSGRAPIIPLRRVCRCSGLPALLGSCDVSHCLRACKERCSSGGPTPPLSQPPTMALYTLSHSHSSPFRLSPAHPTLVLSLGLTSEAWASAPSPHLHQASQAGELRALVLTVCAGRPLSIFPSANWLLRSPLRWSSPSVPPVRDFQGAGNFLLSQLPLRAQILSQFLSLSLFFLHLSYPVMWRFSCHFRSLRSSANIR